MKRKFMLLAGAVVLTAAGAFAGRLTKASPTQLYITNGTGGCVQIASSLTATSLVSTSATAQAKITTTAGFSHKVYASNVGGCSVPVHVKL
jgi:hypothetical protein